MAKAEEKLNSIIANINEHQYEDLDQYLKNDIDWEDIGYILLSPLKVRKFVKSIKGKEVRIDVMKFLHKYAKQYFRFSG